jgi:hypothetical protein
MSLVDADWHLDRFHDAASLHQSFDKVSLWTYKSFCFDNLVYFGRNAVLLHLVFTLAKGLLVAYEL